MWLAYHWLGLLIAVCLILVLRRVFARSGKKLHWPRRKNNKENPDKPENTNE